MEATANSRRRVNMIATSGLIRINWSQLPNLFFFFLNLVLIIKFIEWSTKPVCLSLMCFFNRGNTKGTNASKSFVFDACVYMYCFI